jgi:hypothetical protein
VGHVVDMVEDWQVTFSGLAVW